MFNAEVVEKCLIELIAEFSTSVGNYYIRASIPCKYYVQLLCYSCGFLVGNRDHFHPFCEETLNAKNIHESLALRHL